MVEQNKDGDDDTAYQCNAPYLIIVSLNKGVMTLVRMRDESKFYRFEEWLEKFGFHLIIVKLHPAMSQDTLPPISEKKTLSYLKTFFNF